MIVDGLVMVDLLVFFDGDCPNFLGNLYWILSGGKSSLYSTFPQLIPI